MDLTDASIGAGLTAIIAGAVKWFQTNSRSKEKIKLRELDIEEKGRAFAIAAFNEYKEKAEAEFKELNKKKVELETQSNQKELIIVKLKQIIIRLDGLIDSMARIVENNLKDDSLKQVVKDIHTQAKEAVKI